MEIKPIVYPATKKLAPFREFHPYADRKPTFNSFGFKSRVSFRSSNNFTELLNTENKSIISAK